MSAHGIINGITVCLQTIWEADNWLVYTLLDQLKPNLINPCETLVTAILCRAAQQTPGKVHSLLWEFPLLT